MSEEKSLSRRNFVVIGASAAAAAAASDTPPATAQEVAAAAKAGAHPKSAALPALGARPEAYAYFTAPEIAFVEAAVERLIPTDAHGPGGKEAGCAYFIDQQLAGRYGRGDTMYVHGPWGTALPTQGYQLRYTPAEVYRLGIAATDAYTTKTYGKAFASLAATHQDEVLAKLEAGTLDFDDAPAKVFFGFLLGDTIQGFFADPMYGGNRNKVGWKAVGFPGVGAVYVDKVEQHNKPYRVDPVGIADDMQASMASLDGVPVRHEQTRVAARSLGKDLA